MSKRATLDKPQARKWHKQMNSCICCSTHKGDRCHSTPFSGPPPCIVVMLVGGLVIKFYFVTIDSKLKA